MQRFLDFILSVLVFIIISPFFIPIMIVLRFTGEGEIFYIQQRIGLHGDSFRLLKFATMLKNSSNMGTGDITLRNDPRVLPIGNFLRKSKINELPQILNIIKGDMSIVGPRPHTKRNFLLYSKKIQDVVNTVRPGLTGIGSIIFRDEEGILDAVTDKVAFYQNVIAPYKGELELWYSHNMSIRNYFIIVFATAWSIVNPRNLIIWKIFPDLPKPCKDLEILFGK
jgi:lipopolysaccharide/colanic/teichoic acid biosynthesis glycosyltransferase